MHRFLRRKIMRIENIFLDTKFMDASFIHLGNEVCLIEMHYSHQVKQRRTPLLEFLLEVKTNGYFKTLYFNSFVINFFRFRI